MRSAIPVTALDHKQNCPVSVSIPLVPGDFDGNPTQPDGLAGRNIKTDQRAQVVRFASVFSGR